MSFPKGDSIRYESSQSNINLVLKNRRKGRRGRIAKPPVNDLIERYENHGEHILRFLADNPVPFTNI